MTDAGQYQPGIELRRYAEILANRWIVLVVATALGVLVGVAYAFLAPSTYSVNTTVAVVAITTDPFASNRNSANLVDMSAEVVTASSYLVAESAAEEAGDGWDPAALRRATSVVPVVGSTTLTITVTAASESRARSGAAAMADAYLRERSSQASRSISSVVSRDRERAGELRDQLAQAIEQLSAAAPGSPAAAAASADQQTLNLQISALLVRISSLESIDTTGGVILNPAATTGVSVNPSRTLVIGTFGAVGLLIGVVVAFATHSRSRRFSTPRSLRRATGLDILGELPVDDEDDARMGAVEVAVQRLLRTMSSSGVRVVALDFDPAVAWPSSLPEQLAGAIRASGERVDLVDAVAQIPEARAGIVLIPISSQATAAQRLHVFRVSDGVVDIGEVGSTRIRSVDTRMREARAMGARCLGALVLMPSRGRPATVPGR